MLKRFSSNAAANVFSGVVAATYHVAITAIAVSTWHGAVFTSWGLALSVAAIAPVFTLNLSSVVTRRLMETRHGGFAFVEAALVRSARIIGLGLSGLAFIVLLCAGAWIQWRHGQGAAATVKFMVLLVILLSTNIWLLIWQVRFGQHFADERNWLPALTVAAARGGGIIGMLAAMASVGEDVITSAVGLLAGTWIALALVQSILPTPMRGPGAGGPPAVAEIREQFWLSLHTISGLAFAAAASIIIIYAIPPLIALIAPDLFNAFFIASSFNVLVVGFLSSAVLALLAPLARWNVAGDVRIAERIILYSPPVCVGLALLALLACWFLLEPILYLLTDRSINIKDIQFFLALLGLQTIIRSAPVAFGAHILSAGSPLQIGTPLAVETLLAITVAAPMGLLFGAKGLLLGLSLSGFIGSQVSCMAVSSIFRSGRVSTKAVWASLVSAQLAGSAVWWWISGASTI